MYLAFRDCTDEHYIYILNASAIYLPIYVYAYIAHVTRWRDIYAARMTHAAYMSLQGGFHYIYIYVECSKWCLKRVEKK